MNHIYRLVWNETTSTWAAVAETAKGRGKRSGTTVDRTRGPRTGDPAARPGDRIYPAGGDPETR